jgi:membrane associated rhomboid family serine protease
MAVCYRHPDRETGVSCSNCGNPICTDCMTSTTVGMRCPVCAGDKTKVRTLRSLTVEPRVTYAIMAICIMAWLAEFAGGGLSSRAYIDGATIGLAVGPDGLIGIREGEYWRLLTGGFLHDPRSPIHILFNMYILYWLGGMLEPSLGHVRFAALYLASLFAGSFGALLLEPHAATVGASGAVFGLMGAAFVMQRARGIDPMQSGIGPVILINLALGFVIPNISIGGHLGGLVGGALAAFLMERVGRGVGPAVGVCAGVGAAAIVASLAVV